MRLLSRMSFPAALLFAALLGPAVASAHSGRWQDWDISPTDREHPVTRGLHVGFRAPDRAGR